MLTIKLHLMNRIVSTRIILLACLLSGSAAAIAQAPLSFEPGFVVLAAGDTLRGEVALEADILASRRAVFRPNADSESTTYYPEDILGYGTDSGRHFRALELVPARGAEPERLFLRRLVTGALNLYAFAIDHRLGAHENINARHGHASGRFAIERSSGVVTALYTERRAVRVDGALYAATDHQY